jgi:hypothetical protein
VNRRIIEFEVAQHRFEFAALNRRANDEGRQRDQSQAAAGRNAIALFL